MFIRVSKFYGFCYSDEISEKEFFGKKLEATIKGEFLLLSFSLMKGLDKQIIEKNIGEYSFVEIEDAFIKNKIVTVLNEFPQIKKIQLHIKGSFIKNIKHLKITVRGIKISMS